MRCGRERVDEAVLHKNLPILLGTVRQEAGDGELVLEQNDGQRRFCFRSGELVHLRSEAAGEQFSSYLLGRGIFDIASLNELLAHGEGRRFGERLIETGLLGREERNLHLQALQEQIVLHALEHPIRNWSWRQGFLEREPSRTSPFQLPHRQLLWNTLGKANYVAELLPILTAETCWKWDGRQDVLASLKNLPLTPAMAYATSFLAAEPIGFDTFRFLSGFSEEEAARFIATLWALGSLALVDGGKSAPMASPAAASPSPLGFLPLIMPPQDSPYGPPKPVARDALIPWESIDGELEPEFIDLDADAEAVAEAVAEAEPDRYVVPHRSPLLDLPPCGPRPVPRLPPTEDRQPAVAPQSAPPPRGETKPIELEPVDPPAPPLPRRGLPPVTAGVLLGRAQRQVKLGRTVEAVHTLEEAVDLQPDDETAYEVWLLLGRLRMANSAWSTRAIHALQNASLLRVREAEPWVVMGEVYHRKGSASEARICFRKALELNPSVPIPVDLDLREPLFPAAPAQSPRKGLFGHLRRDKS
jgi:tetratricopeptide (TPR) repeat protein